MAALLKQISVERQKVEDEYRAWLQRFQTKIFPEILKTFRKKHRVTQGELAELLDLHPTYFSAIENGRKMMGLETLKKLALIEAEFEAGKYPRKGQGNV